MNKVEKSAKTVDDAVREALIALGATADEVSVTVLEEGTKGFLGIGAKPAKVLVSKAYDPVKVAKSFLRKVFLAMDLAVEMDVRLDGKRLDVDLKGENMGVLIGKRGQTLESLQCILSLVVNNGEAAFVSVNVDTENYAQKRRDALEKLAINLSKKAKLTKRSVILEPMNPQERRIIHATLQNDKTIKTHSEGDEPHRHVVITLNRTYDKPYDKGGDKGYDKDGERPRRPSRNRTHRNYNKPNPAAVKEANDNDN